MLPFNNLGLIIVDEEHEQSYKQFDPAPRYHARDTAIVLSNLFKSKTLLGSATPSIESYFNATKTGKYGYVELNTRFNDVLMPEIELVDIKDKYKRKRMKGHFSDRMIEEVTDALENNNQVILFQNRRGYSPIVECKTCGQSPQCPKRIVRMPLCDCLSPEILSAASTLPTLTKTLWLLELCKTGTSGLPSWKATASSKIERTSQ